MINPLLVIVWLLLSISPSGHGANILFFFTGGTYSHDISIWPLVIRLADRDHSVTFFSAHPRKPWNDSRIDVIMPAQVEKINLRYLGDTLTYRLANQERLVWDSLSLWSYEICEGLLSNSSTEMDTILYKKRFDLVIIDSVLCDCGHIIAYHHRAKVIVADSTSVLPWYHHIYGFPTESTWLPIISTVFDYPMTIPNIIWNYFEARYWTYIRRTQLYPKLNLLMKKFFKTESPPDYLDLERRADLIFVNTHPSIEFPRSLPPNVIQIGGMQMWGQKNATIPKSIQTFVDKAVDGVILLAFGSSVDFSSIPSQLETFFFNAFRQFPKINFIAQASGQKPPHCPENVQFEKWIPQKEVLALPKTLACITHGGLNGIIEATGHGVPLITLPIFGEQDYHSYKLQAFKVGIRLEIRDVTTENLASAISNIIQNPMYRTNMKKMQTAFLDRPQSPLDLATYWIEYVLKYNDLSFMNPITYQPWRIAFEEWFYSERLMISLVATGVLMIVSYAILRLSRKNVPK